MSAWALRPRWAGLFFWDDMTVESPPSSLPGRGPHLRVSGSRFYPTGALFAHRIPFRAADEQARPVQVWVRREAPARELVTDAASAEVSVAVARAKILTTEAALQASEHLLELAGSSSARAAHNLDRYWRDVRTHTLHDPVRWKCHAIGNHALNGIHPPRHGAL